MRWLLVMALTVTLLSCAGQLARMRTITGGGFVYHEMRPNTLDDGGVREGSVQLNPAKRVAKDGTESYWLIMEYYGRRWLFAGEGPALYLVGDAKPLNLPPEQGLGSRHRHGHGVHEIVYYRIDEEILEGLAAAQRVDVRVNGARGYEERRFNKANFENFRRFVDTYIKP